MRARDIGVPFEGETGQFNAITDVAGVEVGYRTVIEGAAVRTGVTAILPRGRRDPAPVFGGWFSLNGCGEMTGTAWLEESGCLEGPVLLTNTASVGTAHQAAIEWQMAQGRTGEHDLFSLPVVAETYDGYLNDILGFHVHREHVFAALDGAAGGPLAEGNVGGGTGMMCFRFKGGTGTASRRVDTWTVGVLVQANFGRRHQLRVAGLPLGLRLPEAPPDRSRETGSIIIVVATDAPVLPHQCKRLARRAAMGLARTGSVAGDGSGDLMLAFSTANRVTDTQVTVIRNAAMEGLFEATIQATEEAILNAMVAAETMTGHEGHTVPRLPHAAVTDILTEHGLLRRL